MLCRQQVEAARYNAALQGAGITTMAEAITVLVRAPRDNPAVGTVRLGEPRDGLFEDDAFLRSVAASL